MIGSVRGMVLAAAGLALAGVAPAMAQSAPESQQGWGVLVGGGLGFGTSGIHQEQRGDSKPGEFLLARVGAARSGRPFLVADLEWQPFKAPAAPAVSNQAKTEFSGVSVLAGVALYPAGEFYLMPRLGMQFRDWTGPLAADFSDSGVTAGLDLGYHLSFGEVLALSPEVFLRYSAVDGPDNPSHRAIGFRLMAHWRL
jgi:hypothetical protein